MTAMREHLDATKPPPDPEEERQKAERIAAPPIRGEGRRRFVTLRCGGQYVTAYRITDNDRVTKIGDKDHAHFCKSNGNGRDLLWRQPLAAPQSPRGPA
jgi:hypothetical protein